eukprot:TRINITY_DN15005_c0_g1_i2.p1 TRINITY_DN15005_c0_g1~~TRINITY_DN15005_c0_g1_i2.p1  ORF type:complete len:218 (-),score=54.98 TRINITY_DN15005_c0_g1_i2:278-931(-)
MNSRRALKKSRSATTKTVRKREQLPSMVLGANIKPMSSKEIAGMLNTEHKSVLNPNAQIHTITSENKGSAELIPQVSAVDQGFELNNFREFKKVWDKIEKGVTEKTNDRSDFIRLLEVLTQEQCKKIFSVDFEPRYFMKIIYIVDSENFLEGKTKHFLEFFKFLPSLRGFVFNILGFLDKTEKKQVREFVQKLEARATEEGVIVEAVKELDPYKNIK